MDSESISDFLSSSLPLADIFMTSSVLFFISNLISDLTLIRVKLNIPLQNVTVQTIVSDSKLLHQATEYGIEVTIPRTLIHKIYTFRSRVNFLSIKWKILILQLIFVIFGKGKLVKNRMEYSDEHLLLTYQIKFHKQTIKRLNN